MKSNDFYSNLKSFKNFRDITNPQVYEALPDDWNIVIADIKGSTKAIENDRYKDVNIVGASCIIAVVNALSPDVQIPYIFGGDGASFLVPDILVDKVITTLQATKEMSVESFDLELRVGIVPMKDLKQDGKDILVAKYGLSEDSTIPMISGGGISYADDLIKKYEDQYNIEAHIPENAKIEADFGGLECRWKPIKSVRDEMITLIVREGNSSSCYINLLNAINLIYGEDVEDYRPNSKVNMDVSLHKKDLQAEFTLQTHKKGFIEKISYAFKIYLESILGKVLFKTESKLGSFDGKAYVEQVIANTDFQKFDDDLRMVIDSTTEQTKQLEKYLQSKYESGELYYGTHIAHSALMTCLVFDRANSHIHFIDGGNGGYTLAAKQLKQQLAADKS